MEQSATKARGWDRVGILLSGICALHCLLTPIALAVLPVVGESYADDMLVHSVIFAFAAIAAYRAIIRDARNKPAVGLAGAGLILLMFGLWPHENAHASYELGSPHFIINICGSLFLIAAHLIHMKTSGAHKH